MCCFHEGGRLDNWLKLTFLNLVLLFHSKGGGYTSQSGAAGEVTL